MKYNIAVVGATGNVGREILTILEERELPINNIYALASEQSIGKEVSFGDDRTLRIDAVKYFDFTKADIAFFCAGSKVSAEYAPQAAQAGTIVIDKSSYFRMHKDVTLLVPEVNGHLLENNLASNIIASPNCVAIPLSAVLAPLHAENPIKRVVVSTYQSVSGAGRKAMDELFNQTKSSFVHHDSDASIMAKKIAFNVIPCIDTVQESGYTGEEEKIIAEVQKIIDPTIAITTTCVRVPVFIGHCLAINIEFSNQITPQEIRSSYNIEHGVVVLDKPEQELYITPEEIAGEDIVAVSRIRQDKSTKNGIAMWAACDNLRKGAALNAVQIAEKIIASNRNN